MLQMFESLTLTDKIRVLNVYRQVPGHLFPIAMFKVLNDIPIQPEEYRNLYFNIRYILDEKGLTVNELMIEYIGEYKAQLAQKAMDELMGTPHLQLSSVGVLNLN